MRLVTFSPLTKPKELYVGVEVGTDVVNLNQYLSDAELTMKDLLELGEHGIRIAQKAVDSGVCRIPRRAVAFKAPILNPQKVICIGMNYVDHCTEQDYPVPTEPVVFSKFASTVCSPGDPIPFVPGQTEELDYEVEMVIVIGSLIIGYGDWSACEDKHFRAAQNGVNVIIWFATDLLKNETTNEPWIRSAGPTWFDCIANVSKTLREHDLPTTHLISIGGWNAPHPDTTFSAQQWWDHWLWWNTNIAARPDMGFPGFAGFDWDIEGNDDPDSPINYFTVAELDLMGGLSQLAKQAGYLVTMAPAESYLDASTSRFDRNLTHAHPHWQPDFRYHGHNPYAYLLGRYGAATRCDGMFTLSQRELLGHNNACVEVATFDLVSIQLYEGWSNANYWITEGNMTAVQFLVDWVHRLADGWSVDFSSDHGIDWASQPISVKPDRLVIGLANAWTGGGKFLYISPEDCQAAFAILDGEGLRPRGFMFWSIMSEGAVVPGSDPPDTLFLATRLNHFLHVRGGEPGSDPSILWLIAPIGLVACLLGGLMIYCFCRRQSNYVPMPSR